MGFQFWCPIFRLPIHLILMKCIQVIVSGKVQGVWFRASTQKQATVLNIKGTVQNLPTGEVCIEALGTETQIEQFLKWCRQGPPHARVDALKVTSTTPKDFDNFLIIR